MKSGKFFILVAVSLVIIAALLAPTNRPLSAEGQGSDPELSKKLSEIADNQKKILDEIQVIKEDLRIIKIRVTQNQ